MNNDILIGLAFGIILGVFAIGNFDFFFNLKKVRRLSGVITRTGSRIVIGVIGLGGIVYNALLLID